MNMLPILLAHLAVASLLFGAPAAAGEIVCEGTYGGHLQGIATNGADAIYWSFTVAIVKTDYAGKILKKIDAPSHQGDLTYVEGKVFVAVNLGAFNEEPGRANSWVYVYDGGDLSLLDKHAVPEVVHGAGGIAYDKGRFIVIGGLPKGYTENYAYEYDASFKFIERHVINSGYTRMGIQTAARFKDRWWFGCYGDPRELLVTNDAFEVVARGPVDFAVGIAPWSKNECLRGTTGAIADTKQYWGHATPVSPEVLLEQSNKPKAP